MKIKIGIMILFYDSFNQKMMLNFFYGLLNSYQRNHWEEKYNILLERLWVPNEVKNDPRIQIKETKHEIKKENNFPEKIYSEISNTLDNDIKKYFFHWLENKDYCVYLREILNVLSIYLNTYHNLVWLTWDNKEWAAVEAIFKNPKFKITWVDLTTEDWESKKDWLYKLLLWTFKNYRNILSHNKSDDLKIGLWEYLETFLFVNQLLKEVKEKFPLK